MNRKQRRKYEQQLRRKGVTQEDIAMFFKLLAAENRDLRDGDKVLINIERIQSHPNYGKMNPNYKQFLEDHKETVFTIPSVKKGFSKCFIELEEDTDDPKWLWCSDDLILVEEGEQTES